MGESNARTALRPPRSKQCAAYRTLGVTMNIRRLPVAFLVVGLALKATLVFLWRLFPIPGILKLLIYYDPGAFHFAERAAKLFFDQRRLAPTPAESILFEVFLVIGFGIECLLIGFVVQWVLRRFGGPRSAPSMPTTR